MAKTISKITCSIEMTRPDRGILRAAQSGRSDPAGFLESLGGVRCRNRREMEISTDAILLQGTIQKAASSLDTLIRKARKAGLALHKVAA
jgi:hypothetical protein